MKNKNNAEKVPIRRKKKKIFEIDHHSDFPVHEKYVKQEPVKR